MLIPYMGKMPRIAPSSLVSSRAILIGDIQVGENCSIWPGAVIRADIRSLKIGDNVLIEDNAVIHGAGEIGSKVIIGHGAVVESQFVGSYVLIGSNATLSIWSSVGDYCIIGAGALLPEKGEIPSNSLAVGVPAQIKRHLSTEEVIRRLDEDLAFYIPLVAGYDKEDF